MEEEIKEVTSILEQIAELNEMIGMNKENRYLHDQFLNNKAGFVQELQKILAKFDMKVEVSTDDLP
ncbi:MAG: putative component of type VI protein secretion system [Saprospiraceae bacterium]|jgi:predicted component of type VI protein secretion system